MDKKNLQCFSKTFHDGNMWFHPRVGGNTLINFCAHINKGVISTSGISMNRDELGNLLDGVTRAIADIDAFIAKETESKETASKDAQFEEERACVRKALRNGVFTADEAKEWADEEMPF